MHGDLALDLRRMSERLVPARFKFTRHQPVRGVSGIVLPECPLCGITRRFQTATESIVHLILSFFGFLGSNGAAAIAPGPTTPSSASSIASSTRNPPKAMQRGPPLSIQARLQL
jgi:hypothetical protein